MTGAADPRAPAPLVAHVVHRFAVGGLENGVVNLVNHMPAGRYRHAVISLTECTDFRARIRRPDVEVIALGKRPGKDPAAYARLWRVLRRLRPAVVHTRNVGTLDCQGVALAAGVPCRLHGEHGRDIGDLRGESRRHLWLRRVHRPIVHRFVAMSRDLERWLLERVGVAPAKVVQIYNGVDTARFRPAAPRDRRPAELERLAGGARTVIVGSVGRMEPVKGPLDLVRAFVTALEREPRLRGHLRLVHVGDGSLLEPAREILARAGATDLAWLPGGREDVAEILRGLDLFVLPSLAEGISNTVLEAMASGLPVLATGVGGNAELVVDGVTGTLVPPADPDALAARIVDYALEPRRRRAEGAAGRRRAEREFSLPAMVDGYLRLYDTVRAGPSIGAAALS